MLRFGAILDPGGGVLAKLLPWHRRGLSFVLGRPEDPFPWIGLEDALRLIEFCLHESVSGPVNAVSPDVVTQEEFARYAAALTGHRLLSRLPLWTLRLLLGEMSRALTDRQTIVPEKILRLGFRFSRDLPNGELCPGHSIPYSRSLL